MPSVVWSVVEKKLSFLCVKKGFLLYQERLKSGVCVKVSFSIWLVLSYAKYFIIMSFIIYKVYSAKINSKK